mgnify:CR=1 FL=1
MRNFYNDISWSFLISSPSHTGDFFEEAVILLLEDNEDGAFGIAINMACSSIQHGRLRAIIFFNNKLPMRTHPTQPAPNCIPFFLVLELNNRNIAIRTQRIPPFPSVVIFGIKKSKVEQDKSCMLCKILKSSLVSHCMYYTSF